MIDIRTLTPNCHVMLGDKRVKVLNIDSLNNLIGVEEYYYVAQDGTKYCIGNEPKNLDPIPITEELLKELGFGERNSMGFRIKKIDKLKKVMFQPKMEVVCVEEGFINHGFMKCRYLHELEAFVYLTTKQELI